MTLFIPQPDSPLSRVLRYYAETISPQKRSHQTEVYRVKPLTQILGDLPLNGITPMHVVAYRDQRLSTPHPRDPEKTLATSTVKLELMLLSHVFTTATTEWGMDALSNPVAKIRKPRSPPGRSRRLTAQEERKLLRAAHRHPNREFYAILVLALETAMIRNRVCVAVRITANTVTCIRERYRYNVGICPNPVVPFRSAFDGSVESRTDRCRPPS